MTTQMNLPYLRAKYFTERTVFHCQRCGWEYKGLTAADVNAVNDHALTHEGRPDAP